MGGKTPESTTDEQLRLTTIPVSTFDPVAATSTADVGIHTQLFDGLTHLPDGGTTAELRLAREYDVDADGTRYTFSLEAARFHDGTPVTAEDFAYSFERVASAPDSRHSKTLLDTIGVTHECDTSGCYVPGSLGIEPVDDRTLVMRLDEPCHATLSILSHSCFGVLPNGRLGDPTVDGGSGAFAHGTPVGAGPFTFDEWVPGEYVVARRFDDYYDEPPNVGSIRWDVIERDEEQYTSFVQGDTDVISNSKVPLSKYEPNLVTVKRETDEGHRIGTYGPFENGTSVNYHAIPEASTFFLGFDVTAVPRPVRLAVAMVLDQEMVLSEVFQDRGVPAYHVTPPRLFPGGSRGYEKHSEKYPYGRGESRIERARSVMTDAGYGSDDRATLTFTYSHTEARDALSEWLVTHLSDAYVDLTPVAVDHATLHERGREGKLELYLSGSIADWPSEDVFVEKLDPGASNPETPNPATYTNLGALDGDSARRARVAAERVRSNQEPGATEEREAAMRSVEVANWRSVALLGLYHRFSEAFFHDRVELPAAGPLGSFRQKLDRVSLGDAITD